MKTNIRLLIVMIFIVPISIGQGLIFDQEAYDDLEKSDPTEEMGFSSSYLPKKVSYRKYSPAIGNQGNTATCVGWSVAYAQLTTQQNIRMGITNYYQRTARAMDPNFLYAFIKNSSDSWCEKGSLMSDAMYILKNVGCKPGLARPWFYCNTTIKKDDISLSLASPYVISDYMPINITVENVKYFLNKGFPISAGFVTNNSFQSDLTVKTGKWTLSGSLKNASGHAMCVIGYDDNKYGGSFEVMNSYSTEFGDEGFIWISYSDFMKCVREAWVIETDGFNSNSYCLFGNCSTNYSIYKTNDGSYYEGIIQNEYPNLYGTKYSSKGDFYIGGWQNGLINGSGLVYNVEKRKYYLIKSKLGKIISSESMGFATSQESKDIRNVFSKMSSKIPGTLVDSDSQEYEDFIDNFEEQEVPLTIMKE